MERVLLLNMPFHAVRYPSLGLSLLKAAVEREGIPCDVAYLNIAFAERVCATERANVDVLKAFRTYHELTGRFLLLGDWVFSHDLFDRCLEHEVCSPEEVIRNCRQYWLKPWASLEPEMCELVPELARIRNEVSPFLDHCVQSIEWERYGVIGFSSVFYQQVASLALARRIKALYPNKAIVMGGANCEEEMGEALHRLFPFVDVVCSGKADLLFPLLVRCLLDGESIEDIPSIVYRRGDHSYSTVGNPAPRVNLDELPYPDYSDYFQQLQQSRLSAIVEPYLLFESSRGCWWGAKSHCTFCGLNGGTLDYSSKSHERALDELTYLSRRYGISTFVAVDNILDMAYFKSLIPELKSRDLNLQLHYETKANLTKDKVHQLKDAGVCEIRPGIESLSTPILRLMRKGSTALQNLQLLKWTREVGMWAGWTFLLGFPEEDPAEYERMAEMIPAITHLQPPLDCSFVRLDRFSPYFTDSASHGICGVRPLEIYRYIYPFDTASLAQLAYFFDYDYADGRNPEAYTWPVVEAVEAWKNSQAASLTYTCQDDTLVLHDRRWSSEPLVVVLRNAQKEIYEFCDQAHAFSAIEARAQQIYEKKPSKASQASLLHEFPGQGEVLELKPMRGQTFSRHELEQYLHELVDLRLMLRDGDKYLSLALLVLDPTM